MEEKDEKVLNVPEKEKVMEMTNEASAIEEELPENAENQVGENEKVIMHYKRVDTVNGEMTDPDYIEAYKVSQKYDIIFNNLLGDYDNTGEYIIIPEILNALVKMNKKVVRAYSDTLYLETFSEFGDKGKIEFALSFLRGEGSQQKAVLKLLEPISKMNDYIINTQSFVVATYTDINDDDYLKKVRKVFHIYDPSEEVGKEDPEIVNAIIQRLKTLALMKEYLSDKVGAIEEKYFLERIDLLKKPEFEEILKEFERLKNKLGLFLNPDDPLYFLHLNNVLDMAIELHPELVAEFVALVEQQMRLIAREYVKEVKAELAKATAYAQAATKVTEAKKEGKRGKTNHTFIPRYNSKGYPDRNFSTEKGASGPGPRVKINENDGRPAQENKIKSDKYKTRNDDEKSLYQ